MTEMLRVTEQAQRSDTGRQRPHNEDSYLARSPLFVVADGMGGAQSGEVASRMAVEVVSQGLMDHGSSVAERLRNRVVEANNLINERSAREAARQGMGTTLTAVYVDQDSLAVAHVGDSRLYKFANGVLTRITNDHSLVEELVRQGRLSPDDALTHPQRSIITRALGPEPDVPVDTEVLVPADNDIYLLCSDGLTTMISEDRISDTLKSGQSLTATVDELIRLANGAGGRDNITVVAFKVAVEETPAWAKGVATGGVAAAAATATKPVDLEPQTVESPIVVNESQTEQPTAVHPTSQIDRATVDAQSDKQSEAEALKRQLLEAELRRERDAAIALGIDPDQPKAKKRGIPAGPFVLIFLVVSVLLGGYFASQTVYFVGNYKGLVSIYRGVPYELPGGYELYRLNYTSGIPVSELSSEEQKAILDHKLRALGQANELVSKLERGEVK